MIGNSFMFKYDSVRDLRNSYRSTPLHVASFTGRLSCVQYLVKNGASIDQLDKKSRTPLMYACLEGHSDIVGKRTRS